MKFQGYPETSARRRPTLSSPAGVQAGPRPRQQQQQQQQQQLQRVHVDRQSREVQRAVSAFTFRAFIPNEAKIVNQIEKRVCLLTN